MKSKKHVKAGRKGGYMGTGKAKKRGDEAYYAELGRKSGEARRAKKARRETPCAH
jgi:general stress protein YciG